MPNLDVTPLIKVRLIVGFLYSKKIIPVMSDAGITVESYWVNEEKTQFIWIRSYGNDKESIAIAEKKFYDSDWWKENVDIVRGHIAHREFKTIYSV